MKDERTDGWRRADKFKWQPEWKKGKEEKGEKEKIMKKSVSLFVCVLVLFFLPQLLLARFAEDLRQEGEPK